MENKAGTQTADEDRREEARGAEKETQDDNRQTNKS